MCYLKLNTREVLETPKQLTLCFHKLYGHNMKDCGEGWVNICSWNPNPLKPVAFKLASSPRVFWFQVSLQKCGKGVAFSPATPSPQQPLAPCAPYFCTAVLIMTEEPRKQNRLGSPVWAPCGRAGVAGSTRRDRGATCALQGSWDRATVRGRLRSSTQRHLGWGKNKPLAGWHFLVVEKWKPGLKNESKSWKKDR